VPFLRWASFNCVPSNRLINLVPQRSVKRFSSRCNYIQWKGFGAIPLWDGGRRKIETLFFLVESNYKSEMRARVQACQGGAYTPRKHLRKAFSGTREYQPECGEVE